MTDLYAAVEPLARAGSALGEVYRAVYPAMEARYGHWVIFAHCMPFDVYRAYDEARGIEHPRVWTAERDAALWAELEG